MGEWEDREGDDNTAILNLRVFYPDITFIGQITTEAEKGGPLKEGETIEVAFSLVNVGQCPAWNFTIGLLVDNISAGSVLVDRLDAGRENGANFSIVFKTTEGSHYLVLVIDPENNVIETRDQFLGGSIDSNRCYHTVFVSGINEEPSKLLSLILGSGIGIIIALIILAIFFVLWNNRRIGPYWSEE